MGLLEFLSGVTGFDKTSIPSNVRGFIEEVNKANRTREPWHPEAPIRDSMQGYEKGSEKILEFKRGIQRFGILTQEFDFNPSFGDLHASNWYFHVDDILPSVEVLMNQGSAQIQGIFGAHMIDMFNYANQYGVQNDYGRISIYTALVDGGLSLDSETRTLKIELSGSEVNSWPEIMYNRTTNYLRESAVKTAMEDVNKKREG